MNSEEHTGDEPTSESQGEVRSEHLDNSTKQGDAKNTGDSPSSSLADTLSVQSSSGGDTFNEPAFSKLAALNVSDLHFRPQRRTLLPIVLFLATCVSTFWVGCTNWQPLEHRYLHSYEAMGAVIRENWTTGMQYMIAVLAILLTHEMGHFLQTVKHRIAASYPLCIPIPFNAIGTMGAVIGMDGMRADRREIFDIGSVK